jgi:hypothetical protein
MAGLCIWKPLVKCGRHVSVIRWKEFQTLVELTAHAAVVKSESISLVEGMTCRKANISGPISNNYPNIICTRLLLKVYNTVTLKGWTVVVKGLPGQQQPKCIPKYT